MLINQNNAGAFYGRRPVLAHQLPGQYGTQGTLAGMGNTAGPTKTIAQIYLPGSVGSQLVAGLVDKLADKIGQALTLAFPTAGTILYAIVDFLNWMIEPTGRYVEAMAEGVVTYLPSEAAEAVMTWMQNNKTDMALDAFRDTVYARLRRMTPYPGATAKSIAEGRDAVLVVLMESICNGFGVGNTAARLSDKIAKIATDAGAEPWQVGAAVGYGVAVGLRQKGFPQDFSFQIPFTDTVTKLKMGAGTNKLMVSVPSEATKWLSKLATPTPSDLNDQKALVAWIEKHFKEKSGESRTPGGEKGSALPLVVAALALFATNR